MHENKRDGPLADDAQALFTAGEITFVELLQARRDWAESELASLALWREKASAAWAILCALGEHDPPASDSISPTPSGIARN